MSGSCAVLLLYGRLGQAERATETATTCSRALLRVATLLRLAPDFFSIMEDQLISHSHKTTHGIPLHLVETLEKLGASLSLLFVAVFYVSRFTKMPAVLHLLYFSTVINILLAVFAKRVQLLGVWLLLFVGTTALFVVTMVLSVKTYTEESIWWGWIFTTGGAAVALGSSLLTLNQKHEQAYQEGLLAVKVGEAMLSWDIHIDTAYMIVKAWGYFPSRQLAENLRAAPDNAAARELVIAETLKPYLEFARGRQTLPL